MQDKLLSDLLDVLKREYEKYEKLQETADKKKDILVENEIEELADIVQKEDEIITEIEDLENKRTELLKTILDTSKIDEDELNYKELTSYLPDSWKEKFDPVRDRLLNIIELLHQKNEENRLLLQEAIKVNNFSINMLQKTLEPMNNTYNKKKKSETKQGYNIVDRRA